MNQHYTFYTDHNHEWLAVERSELDEMGITDQISGYSYQADDIVYLEGDFDAELFIKAKERLGIAVIFDTHFDKVTPIRGYKRYKPHDEIERKKSAVAIYRTVAY